MADQPWWALRECCCKCEGCVSCIFCENLAARCCYWLTIKGMTNPGGAHPCCDGLAMSAQYAAYWDDTGEIIECEFRPPKVGGVLLCDHKGPDWNDYVLKIEDNGAGGTLFDIKTAGGGHFQLDLGGTVPGDCCLQSGAELTVLSWPDVGCDFTNATATLAGSNACFEQVLEVLEYRGFDSTDIPCGCYNVDKLNGRVHITGSLQPIAAVRCNNVVIAGTDPVEWEEQEQVCWFQEAESRAWDVTDHPDGSTTWHRLIWLKYPYTDGSIRFAFEGSLTMPADYLPSASLSMRKNTFRTLHPLVLDFKEMTGTANYVYDFDTTKAKLFFYFVNNTSFQWPTGGGFTSPWIHASVGGWLRTLAYDGLPAMDMSITFPETGSLPEHIVPGATYYVEPDLGFGDPSLGVQGLYTDPGGNFTLHLEILEYAPTDEFRFFVDYRQEGGLQRRVQWSSGDLIFAPQCPNDPLFAFDSASNIWPREALAGTSLELSCYLSGTTSGSMSPCDGAYDPIQIDYV